MRNVNFVFGDVHRGGVVAGGGERTVLEYCGEHEG